MPLSLEALGSLPFFEAWSRAISVRPIPFPVARDFVIRHHYARGMHNGPTLCTGLFDGERIIGVIAFATPCSEAVRSCVFGPDRRGHVTELHRLVILDETPTNAESWFIARSLRLLRQHRADLEAIVSFADEGHGHRGTVYQASNALYYGAAPGQTAYLDPTGRLRHQAMAIGNVPGTPDAR